MDSQLTLVGESLIPERTASTTLNFNRDSLLNAALYVGGAEIPTYIISTDPRCTFTEVRRLIPGSNVQAALSVRIERNELLPDKIMFEGYPPIKLSSWLKAKTFSYPLSCNPFFFSLLLPLICTRFTALWILMPRSTSGSLPMQGRLP